MIVVAVAAVFTASPCDVQSQDVGSDTPRPGRRKPNILLILADDLAWNDLQCCGGTLAETPHLNQLAKDSVRFTQAYAPAPICSASRASILTGMLPARLQFEFVTKPAGVVPPARKLQPPPYTQNLELQQKTIPEYLAATGYVSAFFGKWHVNEHYQRYLGWSPTHGPALQGFDVATEAFGSHPYAGKARRWSPADFKIGEFPQDDVTDLATEFIQTHADRPFFLYVSHFYVHTPVRSPTDWLSSKYRQRVAADVTNANRRRDYAAFVETLDHYVGQLLTALDNLQLTRETLVIFTSDNGGHPEFASNGPLRGSKWNLYEGGIRVPLMIRWPGIVQGHTLNDTPVTGTDLLPTICDAAGVDVPLADLDGTSLVPLLNEDDPALDSRPLIWHFPYYHPEKGFQDSLPDIGINDFAVSQTRPVSAIRRGSQKLLHFHEDDRVELYDLSSDPGEQQDLAVSQPEAAASLKRLLTDRLRQLDARYPAQPGD